MSWTVNPSHRPQDFRHVILSDLDANNVNKQFRIVGPMIANIITPNVKLASQCGMLAGLVHYSQCAQIRKS
ncbi:hypothetical protein TNCV_2267451 [Trichonephila clavipes]|nr:hypothetical protein TNCV_2267451 [Trichonephila clavipes]